MTLIQWLDNLISAFKKRHVQHIQNSAIEEYVQPPINNVSQNWLKYLSQPYRTQWTGKEDESNCVIRGIVVEPLEAIINYYLQNSLFPPLTTDFLKKNFCNAQGYVRISIRYLSKMCGVVPKQGVSVSQALNMLSICGIVPESLYPDPQGSFTNAEYYQDVPQEVVDFGKETTKLFMIIWQTIWNNNWQAPDLQTLRNALTTCPVGFASSIGAKDDNSIEQNPHKNIYQHARCLYAIDNYLEVLNSFQYPSYFNKLSLSFPLGCTIKLAIKIKTN